MAQQFHRWDWDLELSQPFVLNAPGDVAAIYPTDRNTQFGFAEFVYHWDSIGTGRH